MKKLLILSGKGGTGKTTVAASFLRFSGRAVSADCNADAPNLHLLMDTAGKPQRSASYHSRKAAISPERCMACRRCIQTCRFEAIQLYIAPKEPADAKTSHGRTHGKRWYCTVNPYACEGCGVCAHNCPRKAISLQEDAAGELELYQLRVGQLPQSHLGRENTAEELHHCIQTLSTARLKAGRSNSARLVMEIILAMEHADPDAPLAIIDGPRETQSLAADSIGSADLVLAVAEPSVPGIAGMKRILETAGTWQARTAVCVNKADSSPEHATAIRQFCQERQIPFLGFIPFDRQVPAAIRAGKTIADVDCPARDALLEIYQNAMECLNKPVPETQ